MLEQLEGGISLYVPAGWHAGASAGRIMSLRERRVPRAEYKFPQNYCPSLTFFPSYLSAKRDHQVEKEKTTAPENSRALTKSQYYLGSSQLNFGDRTGSSAICEIWP